MIEIRHLKKVFGTSAVLKDICATIRDGEVVTLIGPSGTGKSTVLNCLNLLEKPTSGEILIDGELVNTRGFSVSRLRQKVGMVFQSFNLFDHLTVIENVMAAPMDLKKTSREEAYQRGMGLLRQVNMDAKAFSYPSSLSGGQKQRAAIARAMAMEPEVLLLDEPTSALDPSMVMEVEDVIGDLARSGMTMVIVTHDMAFARRISTRILFLSDGVVMEDGTPESIFDHPNNPKTRAFVRQLSTEEMEILPDAGSLESCYERLRLFERYCRLSHASRFGVDLIFDDAILQGIALRENRKVKLLLEYSKREKTLTMTAEYEGESSDPFEDGDETARLILMKKSERHTHLFRAGMNHLSIVCRAESETEQGTNA